MANNSQQQNTTLSLTLLAPSECIAWLSVFGIEVAAMVALNALEIIIFIKEPSLRKRDMYLVINQVVADVSVGGFVIIRCWLLGSRCDFWGIKYFSIPFFVLISAFYPFFPIASLLNLTAISLDRMHAAFRPFKHRLVEKKIFGVIIVAVWTTAGLFTTSIALTFLDRPLKFKESKDILSSYFSFFLFCLLIILVSYSAIAIKVDSGNQPPHHGEANRERKLTKTLLLVTVASLLRTLPYVIFQIHPVISYWQNYFH